MRCSEWTVGRWIMRNPPPPVVPVAPHQQIPGERRHDRHVPHGKNHPSRATQSAEQRSGWAGWVGFAGIMLIMLGVFQAIEGFVAIFDDGYYLVRPNGLVINVDYTAWGWLHLIIGLIAVAVGVGLMAGNMVARIVGVIVAGHQRHPEPAVHRGLPGLVDDHHRRRRHRDLRDRGARPGTQDGTPM